MKMIKFIFKLFLIAILIFVILWVSFLGIVQTKQGQEWVSSHAIDFLERQTGLKFQTEKIEFVFPLGIRAFNLSVTQDNEKLADVQQIDLHCLYPHLFQGRVVCSSIKIQHIDLFSKGKSQQPAGAPEIPYYFKIENFHIENLRLHDQILNQLSLDPRLSNYSFSLQGMVSHNPFKSSMNAHMLLTAANLNNDHPPVTLGIDAQNGRLSLSLHAEKVAMPESSLSANVALFASGPVSSWQELIRKLPYSDLPLEGHFKLLIPDKDAKLKGKFHLLSHNELELFDMSAKGANFELHGDSQLTWEGIEKGSFNGEVQANDQKINVQGSFKGPYSNLKLTAKAESPQIKIENHLIENLVSTLEANFEGMKAHGAVQLDFESNQIPCKMHSNLDWQKQEKLLRLSQLTLEALQSHLEGNLNINTSNLLIDGLLQAQSAPLRPITQMIDYPADGKFDLMLTFKPFSDSAGQLQQGIDCNFKGHEITLQDYTVRELSFDSHWNPTLSGITAHLKLNQGSWKYGKLENASMTVYCEDPWKNPAGQVQFELMQGQHGLLQIDQLSGESAFAKNGQAWPFKIQGQGKLNGEWNLNAEGDWYTNETTTDINIAKLSGNYGSFPLHLLQPYHFHYSPDEMAVSPLSLQWGQGQLQAAFSGGKDKFTLDFRTNSISSDLWHTLNPEFPFTGQATAQGHLEGSFQQPVGEVHVAFQKIQITESYLTRRPFIDGEILLGVGNQGLKINSQIFGIGRNPVRVDGTLPFKLSLLPAKLQEDPALQLAMNINAEGELDPYLHLFMQDFPNLSGQAKLALQLAGKWNQPQIHGNLDINNATFESQDTGAIYQNIKAQLEGDGSKILLRHLSAEDSKGGTITAQGWINVDEQRTLPYEFHIQAAQLYILNSDYASISASGPLSLIGAKNKSKLQGSLNVDKAIVKLEEALPKQIKTIDIHYINLTEEDHPLLAEKSASSSGMELDIKLNAQEVLIEGNHLKSSWKGEILISGKTDQPLLYGDLRISSGEYDLKGKAFALTQGSIHFAGSAEKKTTLYVVASKEIDPIRAEMIVKGPLDKLAVSFRSNPPLSQRDVLSYILFGRGISDITPGEGDSLNQSFVSLNSDSTDEKQDLLTRVRNNVGIDRLDITTSGEGENKDVALQVGKYIWKDVLISVNKSIGAASDRLAIEAKLMKNVKAQAEVDIGSSAQGKVSLKWKRDY